MHFLLPLLLAHIGLERANTHLSRYGDDELKTSPCGRKDGMRGTYQSCLDSSG